MLCKASRNFDWKQLARQLQSRLVSRLLEAGNCSLMLTGGRSASNLYTAWSTLPEFGELRNVSFYLTDERWVPNESRDSNYSMVMNTLFRNGLPFSCSINQMFTPELDLDQAALRYDNLLPNSIDILLLSIGLDGHIASIFPYSSLLDVNNKKISAVEVPANPSKRLTITPLVISSARYTIALAVGEEKQKIYRLIQQEKISPREYPAKLLLNANWIL